MFAKFLLGVADCLFSRIRPREYLHGIVAAVFVHFLAAPIARRCPVFEDLGSAGASPPPRSHEERGCQVRNGLAAGASRIRTRGPTLMASSVARHHVDIPGSKAHAEVPRLSLLSSASPAWPAISRNRDASLSGSHLTRRWSKGDWNSWSHPNASVPRAPHGARHDGDRVVLDDGEEPEFGFLAAIHL
jgi:hypothetical protein